MDIEGKTYWNKIGRMMVSIFVQNGINPIHLLVYDLIDYDFRVDSFFHIICP